MPGMKPDGKKQGQRDKSRMQNGFVSIALVAIVAGMLGLSYAAVPLYRIFCQVTGYGGTTQRALAAPEKTSAQMITVRFDANVSRGMPWRFVPVQRSVKVHIGEQKLVFYRAESLSSHSVTGTATFNVTPAAVGRYFKKIQCFCFTEQTLEPHEKQDMSVSFFVDPGFLKDPETRDIHEITLSYTLFEKKGSGASKADKTAHKYLEEKKKTL